MSDNIPFEIQSEIMRRLPAKSLMQFRSVCKAWKSLIDSPGFIAGYSNQQQHLLVSYTNLVNYVPTYVSIVDDDTFPYQRVTLTHPVLVNMFQFHRVVGSSHGLLCLYGYESDDLGTRMALVWNISIRKAVAVVVPNVGDGLYHTVLGFGVCAETYDPKILKITYNIFKFLPWQVEVFTLSTRAWRPPYSRILPRKSIQFSGSQVVVDGVLYWLAIDSITMDGELLRYVNLVISFNMTSEEFREVNLPHSLAYDRHRHNLYITNLRESIVVVELDEDDMVFVVWMMKDGVTKTFTTLFTIYSPDTLSVPGFRKSGEPVIQIADNDADPHDIPSLLAVYEPKSKHISNIGFNGTSPFYVYSYVETLLLLDQPELTVLTKVKATLQSR